MRAEVDKKRVTGRCPNAYDIGVWISSLVGLQL